MDARVAHWTPGSWGGGEYVATKLAETVGEDCVYSLGTPDGPNPWNDVEFCDITEELDMLPIRRLQQRAGRIFEYSMWEDIDWTDLGDPDLVLTSGATTRAILPSPNTRQINYCHSPPRWFYDLYHDRKGTLTGQFSRPLIRHLRHRDASINRRVDEYIANSPNIQKRISRYWNRDSEVIYPPVPQYDGGPSEGYWLWMGRLDQEKGVREVVDVFRSTDDAHLVMIGPPGDTSEGTMDAIKESPDIDYEGFVSEDKKEELLNHCRGLVCNPRAEDFGLVPIEGLSAGKPVLTRDEGFPAQVVEHRKTGLLHNGTRGGIAHAILQADKTEFETQNMDKFSPESFSNSIKEIIA